MIYLDNAATTQPDPAVLESMQKAQQDVWGNPSSMHTAGKQAKQFLEHARALLAERIAARPAEIVFTSGGSESNALAIIGAARAAPSAKKHIVTTKAEHPSVLEACAQLEKEGFAVTYLSVDENGFVSAKDVGKAVTDETILVSIIHGNNEIGTINDIAALANACKMRKENILFHSDCVQSFCKVPITVANAAVMPVDLLTFSAHKLHGPKGAGALYVRQGTRLAKQVFGGHQEHDRRAGTENVASIIGFAKAVSLNADADADKMKKLRDSFLMLLNKAVPNVRINGPAGDSRLCNNVSLVFPGLSGEIMLQELDRRGICCSAGSACTAQSLEPSHVLRAIGLSDEDARATLRFSLSRYSTEEEIWETVSALKEIVEKLD